MNDRIIFHIDMNSYFASVEQQANPHLRARPVGVCEHLGGIIIAPSVEAKRLGIRTATPVWEALRICPDIVLLPVDPPKYRYVTRGFLRIFSDYSHLVERYSIDEAFLDLSHLATWQNALFYALEIKTRIRREIGEWLTCSIGAGPNKLVAKIASDLDKPDGSVMVAPQDIPKLYGRLKLTDIPGIAGRTARRLNALGIYSVRDLAGFPESRLRAGFGIMGHYLREMGNFRGGYDLVTRHQEEIKSMGHSYTLPRATTDERELKRLFFKLSEKIAVRLRKHGFWGKVIACYARFSLPAGTKHCAGMGRSHRTYDLIHDGKIIFTEAWKLFQSFRVKNPVRMAGVSVSGLVENVCDQPLFERYKKPQRMLKALDQINEKYGGFTLKRATLLEGRDVAPDTIGFGRIKELE